MLGKNVLGALGNFFFWGDQNKIMPDHIWSFEEYIANDDLTKGVLGIGRVLFTVS